MVDAPANRIVLEITEHDAIETYDHLDAALSGVRRRGVRVAVVYAAAARGTVARRGRPLLSVEGRRKTL